MYGTKEIPHPLEKRLDKALEFLHEEEATRRRVAEYMAAQKLISRQLIGGT